MSDLTPETLAELRRLLERATPGPWHAWDRGIGYEVHTEAEHNPIRCVSLNSEFRETFRGPDARLIAAAVNALPALLDAAAERDALAESVRAYGRTIDRWELLIIAATHSEDITTPDGDGDWEVIESRLAEVPALLAERDALAAAVERVRSLHAKASREMHYCLGCDEESSVFQTPWPCPTIRALDTTPDTGGES